MIIVIIMYVTHIILLSYVIVMCIYIYIYTHTHTYTYIVAFQALPLATLVNDSALVGEPPAPVYPPYSPHIGGPLGGKTCFMHIYPTSIPLPPASHDCFPPGRAYNKS